jgi:hypothetical protein
MTLPTDVIYPLHSDLIKAGDPESLELYMRNLVETMTERDRQIVGNVNGNISQFMPEVFGLTVAGQGTYPAESQAGWYLRQGIMVDVWFDVVWSAHTGNGFMYLRLPYKVAKSPFVLLRPFAGILEQSTITLGAGYTSTFGEAEPDTFRYNLVQAGSGMATALLALPATGRILGHVRYIGQEIET